MLSVDSPELYELLGECAVLRGQRKFFEAIELVEPRLAEMGQTAQETALLQLIYAATEGGFDDRRLEFARELAKLNPEIPTVKKVLSETQK